MAAVTRSGRRGEGLHHPLHHHHHHHANSAHLIATSTRSPPNIFQSPVSGRTKRPLEVHSSRDFDIIRPKRARITVEIVSRTPIPPPRPIEPGVRGPPSHPLATTAAPPLAKATPINTPLPPVQPPTTPVSPPILPPNPPPPQSQPQPPTTASSLNRPLQQHLSQRPIPRRQPPPQQRPNNIPEPSDNPTAGPKHNPGKVQSKPKATGTTDGRKLRSQEATRFKSELSAYFPDYDEVIGNDPKEHHILNADTPIILVNSSPRRPETKVPLPSIANWRGSTGYRPPHEGSSLPIRRYGDSLFDDLFDSQCIDFGFLETRYKGKTPTDPLPDSYFEPAHKKAERLERSIRNSERGRAQHEKDQIIRLLEGLQGPDWLRTMGVSGITEGRKKSFEPAREYFVKGCQGILEKFRQWNMEEKRRKLEKDRAGVERAGQPGRRKRAASESSGTVDSSRRRRSTSNGTEETGEDRSGTQAETSDAVVDEDTPVDSDTPDGSDIDASVEKQLREEAALAQALARSRTTQKSKSPKRSRARRTPSLQPPEPPEYFRSFFKKKHERDGALSHHRRGGRKVLAWGHPLPDMPEADFELPRGIMDDEVMKSHARRRRRDKRGSRP